MATIFIDHKEAAKGFRLLKNLANLDPSNPYKIVMLLTTGCQICYWDELKPWYPLVSSLGVNKPLPPWSFLALEDDPANQKKRAELWSQRRLPKQRQPFLPENLDLVTGQPKIKVGYLSADFHDHATMHLIEGMVRCHDRQRFTFVWISYGKFKSGQRHRAIRESGDEFLDLQNCDTQRATELIREKHLDIAIDLKGYTQDERTHYFEEPIARIHIQYLGYPGTLGSKHFDYLIGDSVVIPPEEREHYVESVIFLPHSYQPNDDLRPRQPCKKGREAHKLPAKSFVMCCFNQSIKIQPAEVAIWLTIMQQKPNVCLWMLRSNDDMVVNLKALAESYEISPDRLIFAEKVPQKAHLARHVHADLCVDTFFYNAHTTASDSLWMGTPFVTKAGRQFGARVCASLLKAVGLDELITHSNADYQAKILEIIDNPQYLREIKNRLGENITQKPLFDTSRFTKNFEQGLIAAYERSVGKLLPSDIHVTDSLQEPVHHHD